MTNAAVCLITKGIRDGFYCGHANVNTASRSGFCGSFSDQRLTEWQARNM